MSRSLRAHLLLLAVAALWGATFVLVKDALGDISPLLFNLLRMALAFACLAVVYRRHLRRISPRAIQSGAVVGLFLAAGYQFQTAGLGRTTPSKSAFITGLVVVLVPLLAVVPALRPVGGLPPRWNAWVGALLAFAGIVLLTLPAPGTYGAGSVSAIHAVNTGDLLTLGCALAFALHCIALSKASGPHPSAPHPGARQAASFEQLALLQIGFCALFIAVSTPVLERSWIHITPRLLLALAVTSVLATAAAFSIQTWAQQFLPATHTVLILSMEPVFAALTSFVLLGERLGLRAAMGAGLVLGGIVLTEITPPLGVPGHTPTAHEAVTTSQH